MAWRDSRRGRKRLFLFSMSIMLGIAALVAIGSLKENLMDAVEDQAKSLVGSDVFINARRGFTPATNELLDQSGANVCRETSHLAGLRVSPRARKAARCFEWKRGPWTPRFPSTASR